MTSPETSVSETEVWAAAAAIAREGFPKGREGASDYRRRLARAALTAAAQVRAQAPRSSQYDALLGLLVDVVEPGWPLTSDQAYAMKITAAAAGQIIAALGIRKGE